MPFEKIAGPGGIAAGEMMEIVRGERRAVVCNVEGELHAMDGVCPHRNGPLAQGALHGRMVVCPWHAWEFDCMTGEHDFNPELRLRKFAVETREDGIYLDLE
jgi:nitrite reductase (NADH) small subunit